MGAIEILRSRTKNRIVQDRFIHEVLTEEAKEIMRAQDRVINRFGVRKLIPEITRRRFSVGNDRLTFTHPIRQRFIDMRKVRGQRQKRIPIHNRIIYSHFNKIINQLANGFTEDVKNLIANKYNIEL